MTFFIMECIALMLVGSIVLLAVGSVERRRGPNPFYQ
jgi:hypothetical protein